jgi:DNA polymerase-3 subunit epsilon
MRSAEDGASRRFHWAGWGQLDAHLFIDAAGSFMTFGRCHLRRAQSTSTTGSFLTSMNALSVGSSFPELCTCAGVRRRYPRHKSYSLGKLCNVFKISLENHHRALCDARAAARLINLANNQRDQGMTSRLEEQAA